MDITRFYDIEGEKPLDNLVTNGGYCGIFRTIVCIGDSLSSGELESFENGEIGYHDFYEYSWGQFMARITGAKVYNFSKGGMRADTYCEGFANSQSFWSPDLRCDAYVIALGVNDVSAYGKELGNPETDIDLSDWRNNKKTFVGYYAQIIQRLREIEPKSRIFLMTIPRSGGVSEEKAQAYDVHRELLYKMAEMFEFTYVIDLRRDAPVYDNYFGKKFFLGGHMNSMGYLLTAKMVTTYIDYIIRHNMDDFVQVGFIGKGGVYNSSRKW